MQLPAPFLVSTPPASEALPSPAKTQDEIQYEKDEAERVKYSVMLGSHDYDALEMAANEIIEQYEVKK